MKYLDFTWIINGKLAGHQAPSCELDLAWLKQQGVLALVKMAEQLKAEVNNIQINKLGMWDCHEPVPDFSAPELGQIHRMIQFIENSLLNNRPVGISCRAGLGRTGTILACYLVSQGYGADAAIKETRKKRPGSIETQEQEDAIKAYALTIGE